MSQNQFFQTASQLLIKGTLYKFDRVGSMYIKNGKNEEAKWRHYITTLLGKMLYIS